MTDPSPAPTTNRLDHAFQRLRAAGQKAFVAYVAAGDPDLPRTWEVVRALARAGVDVVELGIPFSDPLADGLVNQLAAARALAAGTTLPAVLRSVAEARAQGLAVPLVLYTYMNPVYAYGFARFLAEAEAAGVDGVLLLDLPPDEALRNAELRRPGAGGAGLRLIRLLAPTTPPARVSALAALGEGFLYCVSREGVTGERQDVSAGLAAQLAAIRQATALPVVVGFGVSTPAQARAVAALADGVVVGSAIVRRIGEWGAEPDLAARVEELVRPLVAAVKAVPAG